MIEASDRIKIMIYLDNAATAVPNQEAIARAAQFATENFFNPSALYAGGVHAELKKAREYLLSQVAGSGFELIFTSGGTEADNQAVFCGAKRGNAVTTGGEHAAVQQSFVSLKNRGLEARFAPLKPDGSVQTDQLLELVDDKTSLVSVVHVNNETGAVNDIEAIAKAVKKKNPRCLFHSDGVQSYGKIPFRLTKEIDLYSISAHKIGGLKGTGALIKRKDLVLPPLICGGGQEGNLRSGTENVLGVLSFSYAAEKKFASLEADGARLGKLREEFWQLLDKDIFTRISPESGTPYILNISARGLRGEILQRLLGDRGIVVGTGSACSSKKPHSRVIEACGYDSAVLDGVLRLSFSPETTEKELIEAATALNESAKELKKRIS